MVTLVLLFAGGILITGGLLGCSLSERSHRGEIRRQAAERRRLGEQRRSLEAERAAQREEMARRYEAAP